MEYLKAYFFVIIGTIGGFCVRPIREFLLEDSRGRLLLVWIVVVYFLMNNQWILRPYGIQPAHFSRGYLFFPLGVISCLFLSHILKRKRIAEELKSPRVLIAGACLFLLVTGADNLIFVKEIFTSVPHPEVLTFRKETAEALEFLDSQGEEGEYLNVLNLETKIGILIPAYTRHNSFSADIMATPNFEERGSDLKKWIETGGSHPLLSRYRIDLIILPSGMLRNQRLKSFIEKNAAPFWQNALWSVYQSREN